MSLSVTGLYVTECNKFNIKSIMHNNGGKANFENMLTLKTGKWSSFDLKHT
jgi:hypothetical protein